ncbi:hypothetical protein [Tsukamurella pulmonis]|nr:hypothetical protein [Tsukamurella pulmonis]
MSDPKTNDALPREWPPTTWPDGTPITEEQRRDIDAAKAKIRIEDL